MGIDEQIAEIHEATTQELMVTVHDRDGIFIEYLPSHYRPSVGDYITVDAGELRVTKRSWKVAYGTPSLILTATRTGE